MKQLKLDSFIYPSNPTSLLEKCFGKVYHYDGWESRIKYNEYITPKILYKEYAI